MAVKHSLELLIFRFWAKVKTSSSLKMLKSSVITQTTVHNMNSEFFVINNAGYFCLFSAF